MEEIVVNGEKDRRGMTREEAVKVIENRDSIMDYCESAQLGEALEMAIKALSAEPCEDAISFPKGTLKKRGKGYVVYDVEWFKKNWRTELNVMGVECEDAISRAWIKEAIHNLYHYSRHTPTEEDIQEYIVDDAPPVTPKQKMGRWIEHKYAEIVDGLFESAYECSYCHGLTMKETDFCPECGAKMVDVTDINAGNMSENPTGSNCTACILDGTDACSRGAGRAVDGRVCEDFVGESED